MQVDIPNGNEENVEAAETHPNPKPETAPTTTNNDSPHAKIDAVSNKKHKILTLIGIIVVIAALAIVLSLVPNWGNKADENNKPSTITVSSQSAFYESSEGPYDVRLPLLSSSDVTSPYSSVEEAKHDIEQLARFIVNRAIQTSAEYIDVGTAARPENSPESDGADATTAGSGSDSALFEDITDFETYQQEAGVKRSDFVKSNGDYVFAAIEDRILVWNLEGDLLKNVTMPPINTTGQKDDGIYYYPPEEEPIEEQASGTSTTTSSTAEAKSSYMWREPKPYIQALLLNGSRLTVVVGGYGMEYIVWGETLPILDQFQETFVIVYDFQDGILTEVSQTRLNGNHADSYSVGNNVHIVTKAGLNTWSYLVEPLQRWNPEFQGMDFKEYEAAAKKKADSLIPTFVEKVLDLVTVDGRIILSRLVLFADTISDDDTTTEIVGNSIANSITQVHSLDVSTVTDASELTFSASAILHPGYWGYVYATSDWIWVLDQGWDWVDADQRYFQGTILSGFKLDGPSSAFSIFGFVPGTLLNQFSVDFYKDQDSGKEFIRAATTINFWWGPWLEAPQDAAAAEFDESRTKNQVVIMELPTQENDESSSKLIKRGSVSVGKKDEVGLILFLFQRKYFDIVSLIV